MTRNRVPEAILFFLLFGFGTLVLADTWFGRNFFGIQIPLSVEILHVTIVVSGMLFAGIGAYAVLLSGKARSYSAVSDTARELALAREELRRLYDQGPVPHLLISEGGNITNPNMAALRFFKLPYESLEGRDFRSLVFQDDKDRGEVLYTKFKHGVPFEREEIRVVRGDDAIRFVLLSVFVISHAGRRGKSGLVTLVDVTEAKELEEAKTQFVSLASHQLRTPITTIKWYIGELLAGGVGELSEKEREYLTRVASSNENMIDIVDTLLNVSRIEMGRLQINPSDVRVHDVAESVFEELEPLILKKKLVVHRNYEPHAPILKTDAKLLRIVLQNLLSNAVKYTPDGGSVSVNTSRGEEGYTIAVLDTGYGIPPSEQDKVFTKLFRANNVRELELDGNGLGLYLTKSIVELLGGRISFTSALNRGTTFTVVLP